jgi:hypothetical protein
VVIDQIDDPEDKTSLADDESNDNESEDILPSSSTESEENDE